MGTETSHRIVQYINEILAAVGQKDFDALRATAHKASVLLANLAERTELVATISNKDLAALIEQPEQERKVRLLVGLKEYLPEIGKALIRAAQTFPQPHGGRPARFKDRDLLRRACRQVVELIEKGCSEAEAKRAVAKELRVSPQTMNRAWKRRTELAEPSFEEFFLQLLKSLSVESPSPVARSDASPPNPLP